jgi:hypothetical protein
MVNFRRANFCDASYGKFFPAAGLVHPNNLFNIQAIFPFPPRLPAHLIEA